MPSTSLIGQTLNKIQRGLPLSVKLVAVSKTHGIELIEEAYAAGQRAFAENKVQELLEKAPHLPADIEWHLIGHLQTNKVKQIASFVHLIHSVDSLKLLKEINKEGVKHNRVIAVLLQVYIASEETKFGLSMEEVERLLALEELGQMKNIRIDGLMGMASNTANQEQIRKEFKGLFAFFSKLKQTYSGMQVLSMGMSSDYQLAIEEGSTMVRLGSVLFGARDYSQLKH